MSKSLAEVLPLRPPKALLPFLEDLPLVADEKAEDYYNIFNAIVVAAEPLNAIDWLHTKCVVDLTWEIKREQAIKVGIIEWMRKEIVLDLLKTTRDAPNALDSHIYRIFGAANEVNQWATDPSLRQTIDATLAEKGYPPLEVLARAYVKGEAQIDAIGKRIESYEARRMVALREIERRNEKFSQRLKQASADIIDAEFSEAAE